MLRPIHATQTTLGRTCPFCGKAELVPVTIWAGGAKSIVWVCPKCRYRRYPKMTKYMTKFRTSFRELSAMVEAEAALLKAAAKKSGEVV